jgi:hypothetical protein
MFPATVIVCDQFRREYRVSVTLSVNRKERYANRARSESRGKRNLFDHRDLVAHP